MLVYKADSFSAEAEIINFWLKNRRPIAHGGRKMDEARADGQRTGVLDGLSAATAAMLNGQRFARYSVLLGTRMREFLPGVDNYTVRGVLLKIEEEWDLRVANKDNNLLTDDEWLEEAARSLHSLMIDRDLDQEVEKYRRDRILAGAEEPRLEDAEWLAKEYETYAALTNPLKAALEKLPRCAHTANGKPCLGLKNHQGLHEFEA